MEIDPIGVVRTRERYRYEAPRQGVFASNTGTIELFPADGMTDALCDLAGFERIWVVFKFHLNQTWKPKVSPPVISPAGRRVGVFASRSPHRPNPIGLSCVELTGIEGLVLHIASFDMLDNTPVFDIKPYIPLADAFPDARAGWVDETRKNRFEVEFTPLFMEQNQFIGTIDLANFCAVQLAVEPLDHHRKRLTELGEGHWEIACRTWRIEFSVEPERKIAVHSIRSGYSPSELSDPRDPYDDKELHRLFAARYH